MDIGQHTRENDHKHYPHKTEPGGEGLEWALVDELIPWAALGLEGIVHSEVWNLQDSPSDQARDRCNIHKPREDERGSGPEYEIGQGQEDRSGTHGIYRYAVSVTMLEESRRVALAAQTK